MSRIIRAQVINESGVRGIIRLTDVIVKTTL
jgi:hypothetical protein